MSFTRREWLRRTGLLGASLWLGDGTFRYAQALTQPASALPSPATGKPAPSLRSAPRKLALLVGINQYPRSIPALKGCVTDVELHAALLIYRFGFAPADVLTLTDEAATRSNIESAFITHLGEQARPGDIVVFHFSGYGCLIRTKQAGSTAINTAGEQQAIAPVDVWVPSEVPGAPPIFNGIYEDTLFLLLRSLLTDQVTTILDVGFQPSLTLQSQSLRERSLPLQELSSPSAAEFTLQERLLQKTQLTRDQVQVQRQAGQLPGLVLTAAAASQPTALEVDWPEFSAGLFSYGLTQQLWGHEGANLTLQFNRLSMQMAQQVGLVPQPVIRGQKSFSVLPWALGSPRMPQAVGQILSTNRTGQTSRVWLGGLRAELLAICQPQSCFWVVPPPAVSVAVGETEAVGMLERVETLEKPEAFALQPSEEAGQGVAQAAAQGGQAASTSMRPSIKPSPNPSPELSPNPNFTLADSFAPPTQMTLVQLRSRRGWTAIAERQQGQPLREGDFLVEAIRVLPKAIVIRLALGSDLSRIERVDATSFISVENKSLQVVSDKQPADYIFTKVKAASTPSAASGSDPSQSVSQAASQSVSQSASQAAQNTYGLMSLGSRLLPNTGSARSPVVKIALQRLRPTLDALLALKLLELSVNSGADLALRVTLEQVEDKQAENPAQPLIRQQTSAIALEPVTGQAESVLPKADKSTKVLSIPSGTLIQYRLYNGNPFPVYAWLVGVNSAITMFCSYAKEATSPETGPILKPLLVPPGATVTLPAASQNWKASSMAGFNQAFLIVTRQPLTQTLEAQENLLKTNLPSAIAGFIPLPRPLPVVQQLFEDLHRASLSQTVSLGIQPKKSWALDINAWVSFQFLYRTV